MDLYSLNIHLNTFSSVFSLEFQWFHECNRPVLREIGPVNCNMHWCPQKALTEIYTKPLAYFFQNTKYVTFDYNRTIDVDFENPCLTVFSSISANPESLDPRWWHGIFLWNLHYQ